MVRKAPPESGTNVEPSCILLKMQRSKADSTWIKYQNLGQFQKNMKMLQQEQSTSLLGDSSKWWMWRNISYKEQDKIISRLMLNLDRNRIQWDMDKSTPDTNAKAVERSQPWKSLKTQANELR